MSLGAILTAVVTPMNPDGSIDEPGFVELLTWCAENGSDGFVVCGTTGEAPTLTTEEHLRMIELAVQERPAGTTVIAGAGSNDTAHAVAMTSRAAELGADAILSVTPYYNRPNRRGVRAHYEAIAAASDLPIVLYNIPSRTGLDLPNDQLAELAEIPSVRYVKQANPDNLAPVDGLGIYAGNDDMLAEVLDMGARAASSWPAISWAARCARWSTTPVGAQNSTRSCARSSTRWELPPTPSRSRRRCR